MCSPLQFRTIIPLTEQRGRTMMPIMIMARRTVGLYVIGLWHNMVRPSIQQPWRTPHSTSAIMSWTQNVVSEFNYIKLDSSWSHYHGSIVSVWLHLERVTSIPQCGRRIRTCLLARSLTLARTVRSSRCTESIKYGPTPTNYKMPKGIMPRLREYFSCLSQPFT